MRKRFLSSLLDAPRTVMVLPIIFLLLGAGGPLIGVLVMMLLYCYYCGWKSRKPRGESKRERFLYNS